MCKPVGKYQFTMACIKGFSYDCVLSNTLSYFSTKTYVVGTQKNRRNETVLLSTKLKVKSDDLENIYNFKLKKCVYLDSDIYSMQI